MGIMKFRALGSSPRVTAVGGDRPFTKQKKAPVLPPEPSTKIVTGKKRSLKPSALSVD